MQDLHGTKMKYRWLRRGLSPLVHRFIALSQDLESYLVERVGISPTRITRIINGVDTEKYRPRALGDVSGAIGSLNRSAGTCVIGAVTRMQEVKDPLNLVRAFRALVSRRGRERLRLVMVGDGPLLPQVERELHEAGVRDLAALFGSRDDVPELMRHFDLFVLSSRVEGISNTVLEAMASGVPTIATDVGGNRELIVDGATGALVAAESPEALADALELYVDDTTRIERHGVAARERAVGEFGLDTMVRRYAAVYDELLTGCGRLPLASSSVEKESTTTCAG